MLQRTGRWRPGAAGMAHTQRDPALGNALSRPGEHLTFRSIRIAIATAFRTRDMLARPLIFFACPVETPCVLPLPVWSRLCCMASGIAELQAKARCRQVTCAAGLQSFATAVNFMVAFAIGQSFLATLCAMRWGTFLFYGEPLPCPSTPVTCNRSPF